MNYRGIKRWACIMLVTAVWSSLAFCAMRSADTRKGQESRISIVVKPLKRSYKPGEAVSLAVAVANHDSQPLYIPVCDPEVFNPYFRIKDANGVIVSAAAIDDPNRTIPGHYYMQQGEKSVSVFPVLEIRERGLILTFIPNALKRHPNQIAAGRYYLETSGFPIIAEPTLVISRPDYPQWLWVDQESTGRTLMVKHEPIEVIVAGTVPQEKPLGFGTNRQTTKRAHEQMFAWSSFVAGALCGIAVLLASLALKNRLAGR